MQTINSTIPQSVLDAALALHKEKNTNLSYGPIDAFEPMTAKEDLLWSYVEDRIEFFSLEARNHCTALATLKQGMTLSTPEAFFDAAHELWRSEISHSDSAAGRLLGLASKKLNVLMEAAQVIRSKPLHASKVFQILRVIAAAFPHLSKVNAEAVIAVVEAQYEATKRDMAVGVLFNAIERYLRSEPQLAWNIWKITSENMLESMQNLYMTALESLLHTDQQSIALEKARAESDHVNPLIAGAALWVLSRAIQVHTLQDSEVDKCTAVLVSKTRASSIDIQQAATRAVAQASLKNERLLEELVRLSAEPSSYTLAVIADFLFMNQDEFSISSPHFITLLQALVGLSPSQKGAIDNFDWVLHKLHTNPETQPLVLDCLTQWMILHGGSSFNDRDSIELFDQTISQIANHKPGLQVVITRWLLDPEKQLAMACGGLIDYLHIRGLTSPTFSTGVLNTFGLQDFKFLARRLLGYVISVEPLLSLTFSLLETNNAPARTFGWVSLLLTNEIGRDYAYSTMEALKARQETAQSPEKELLEQIHANLLRRSSAIDDLPRLQELRPPTRLRRAIALNRAREMETARQVANEKSIIRLIATEIPMKAGRGWFSVSENKVEPTRHLQSISHSVSIPKRSFTDPVGYAIAGLHYRIAKRDDE